MTERRAVAIIGFKMEFIILTCILYTTNTIRNFVTEYEAEKELKRRI